MVDLGAREYMKLAIFYGSYLAPFALIWCVSLYRRAGPRGRWLAAGLAAATLVFLYARFIEPRRLLVIEREIPLERCFASAGEARLAVVADMHIGLFRNSLPMTRIVRRLGRLDADAALIPGDFTNRLDPERFDAVFGVLGDLETPVYAVLGIHDVGAPGPDLSEPLRAALGRAGVIDVENRRVRNAAAGGAVEIAGLADLWGDTADFSVFDAAAAIPRIGVVHIPEAVYFLGDDAEVDLMVAGHTHGGQVNLYGLTCLIKPMACRVVREGYLARYRRQNSAAVFVTAGTGLVGLPVRFNVPPRIDMLNLRWEACGD
ncbi:MAG: metallophosphoesterase [Parvularculaceae bacterium]